MPEPTSPAPSPVGDASATPARPKEPAEPVETVLPQYKGGELDPARGPGLGCFWVQIVMLVALLVVTPLTVAAGWPPLVSMVLLFAIIVLLLVTGQTMIFLLRLVAADRGRRRPLASSSRTVGDIEDEQAGHASAQPGDSSAQGSPERSGSVRE